MPLLAHLQLAVQLLCVCLAPPLCLDQLFLCSCQLCWALQTGQAALCVPRKPLGSKGVNTCQKDTDNPNEAMLAK